MPAFVSLTRAFGGTRFGPFDGPYVALGSDPEQCHIVLPRELGVYPVHAWLTIEDGGTFVLQPAEQRATVYSHAHGTPMPLTTAVRLGSSQQFSLVSPDGARFIVEYAAPQADHGWQQGMPVAARGQGDRSSPGGSGPRIGGRRMPTAGDLAAEARRQAGVHLMTGPLAQFSHLFHRLQSGALFQPRYIIGALVALGGVLFTGCTGLLALLHLR
jgi:hypothetical protein